MTTDTNSLSIRESWDPLEDTKADHGILSAAQKRQIQNILKSYTGYYDVFAELIQNALDAVERRIEEGDTNYVPSVWIQIDIKEGKISVTDNGCGMDETEFRQFLRPNFSFKDANINRGNKGVGATYLAYGFNHLEIATKTRDRTYSGVIRRGREWVEDSTDSIPNPKVEIVNSSSGYFNDIDRGASMSVKLEGVSIRPNDLSWIGAKTAEQWLAILRVVSPLGGVYTSGEQPLPIKAIIEVTDMSGDVTKALLDGPRFLYPKDVLNNVPDLREYLEWRRDRVNKNLSISVTPNKFSKVNGLWGEWSTDDILDDTSTCPITLNRLSNDDRELVSQLGVSLHVFLGHSVDIWDNYNDNTLGIRKGHRILRGGIQLCTKHMPQGSLLTIPLNRNIGMQNQAHVLIHFMC